MSSTSVSNSTKDTHSLSQQLGGDSWLEVLSKNSKAVITVSTIVLLGTTIWAWVSAKNEQKSDSGRNALYLAEKSLTSRLESLAKAEKLVTPTGKDAKAPSPGADSVMFKKLDVDTSLGEAVTQFKSIAAVYAGSLPGFEATLELAKLYLNHGNPAQAAEWFTKATQAAPTSLDRALAWQSLGYAFENQAKYKEAVDAFDHALGAGETAVKGEILMSKARAQESLKDVNQAKSTYDQIISQLPNTEFSKLATLYKSRL